MKKLYLEILLGILFVLGGTYLMYGALSGIDEFWTTQNVWDIVLLVCLTVVSAGYWRQGSIIHQTKSAKNISALLPFAVFAFQCILFVKGVYYDDYALALGAVLVNSSAVFYLYQIYKFTK